MATDWAADVRKYVPDADDAVIKGIVRYCGIALQEVDSSLVSFSDPKELDRVRNNFLKKKCGLTDSDAVLDAAIARVGERMKADRTKNRVTVYYLLVEHFGLHGLFVKAARTAKAAAPAAAGAAGAAALAAVAPTPAKKAPRAKAAAAPEAVPAVASADIPEAIAAAPVAAASVAAVTAQAAAPMAAVAGGTAAAGAGLSALGNWGGGSSPLGRKLHLGGSSDGSGAGLLWLAGVAAVVFALFWIGASMFPRVWDTAPAPAAVVVAAPVEVAPTIPDGAGIISETRDEKPVVKVYFDTGKAVVAPAFAGEAAAVKAYLDANPGSIAGVSGYNDPTGNAAANAELSKNRAQAVQAALVAIGVPAASIELIKPEAATDATVTKEEARRVEVYIK